MTESKLKWFLRSFVPEASDHYPLHFIPICKMLKESLNTSQSDFSLVRCDSCDAPLRWEKWSERQYFGYHTGETISSFSFKPFIPISSCFYSCDCCGELQDYPEEDSFFDRHEQYDPMETI